MGEDPNNAETLEERSPLELAETFGAAGLTVETDELEQWIRRFKNTGRGGSDIDSFLEFLLDEGVLDPSQYSGAGEQGPIRFEWIDLDELPTRAAVYQQLGTIGSGGMGEVRLAYDRHLDRRVAIKIIKKQRVDEGTFFRFLQEGQVTSKLQHPNIVPIYGLYGERNGSLSIAMKLVTGRDLTDVIRELAETSIIGDSLPEEYRLNRRLSIFLRACDAIAFAHSRGVIHRDLKPANIMVGEFNEVYVMDWGLAKLTADADEIEGWTGQIARLEERSESAETVDGQILGTPLYMSPEQARGHVDELDEATDQYALGAILYEMVTLRQMFAPKSSEDVLHQVKRGQKRPIMHADGNTPIADELSAIIEKATALDKRDRYASVDAFADDLRAHLDNQETRAMPDTPLRRVSRWMANNREATLVAVLGVLLAASVVAVWSLTAQNATIRESEVRTEVLSKLQTRVASRATAIDAQVTRLTSMAESLAFWANLLREDEDIWSGPIYSNEDYQDPQRQPTSFRFAPAYDMKISIEQPVFKLAPGTPLEQNETTIRKMIPIARLIRDALRSSAIEKDITATDWERIGEEGVPLKWGYVGFESGLFVSFPGKDGYPQEYDPRVRPWYKLGASTPRGGSCDEPYVDLQGQGLLLPCVAPIREQDGSLVGVAGVELAFDEMVENYMWPDGPVEATYLVNADGEILISSHLEGNEYVRGELREAEDLEPFPYEEVRQAILDGTSGPVWVGPEDAQMLFMISSLSTRPGAYVEQAPWSALRDW
ncbi:MAG: protein kinase domain-containing protein [Myxococcota bacterium]